MQIRGETTKGDDSENADAATVEQPTEAKEGEQVRAFTRDDRFRFLARDFKDSIEALRETHDELLPAASNLDSLTQLWDGTVAASKRLSTEDLSLLKTVFADVPEDGVTAHELTDRVWNAVAHTDWGPAFAYNFMTRVFRPRRQPIFHNAILISVVAAFESHLAKLAEEYYRAAPEALHKVSRESAKEFSLRELQALGSIEDAVQMAIEQRVTALMFGSLSDWKKFFADRLNIDLSALMDDWATVLETFERRHCIVHSEARASRRYVRNYPKVQFQEPLNADSDYVHQAMENLELLGTLLLMAVWSKFALDQQDVVDSMEAIGFSALKENRWQFSHQIYEKWQDLPLSGAEQHMANVNLWIARKNLFGLDSVSAEIRQWDVSGSSEIYEFAKLCLLEELEEAFDLLPTMIKHEHIAGQELATWPLLAPLRDDARINQYAEIMRDYLSEETDSAVDKTDAVPIQEAASITDPASNTEPAPSSEQGFPPSPHSGSSSTRNPTATPPAFEVNIRDQFQATGIATATDGAATTNSDAWRSTARRIARKLGRPVKTTASPGQLRAILTDWPANAQEALIQERLSDTTVDAKQKRKSAIDNGPDYEVATT